VKGTLREDQYTFFIISRSFLLRIRNVSDKSCREKIKTHFMFSNFFPQKNRAVYEIMWKSIVERGRSQLTIWRTRIACWIPKTTNTHTLRLCTTLCFSTATVHLNITFYIHWLSGLCLLRLRWCNFCCLHILLLRANYSHVLN